MSTPTVKEATGARRVLVTGGAGFVGSNLVERLLAEPDVEVRVLDNVSRRGVQHNVEWLRSLPGSERLNFLEGDVRDREAVQDAVRGVSEIYHLAAQVAVTTSLDDPLSDFETNALGTFHVLEAARLGGRKPFILYTSTNKVYGSLHGVPAEVEGSRYVACDRAFRGVEESEPLDFHSPYGCSKGAADQYVRDYGRIYDLPTVVFRMSCVAGPRQFGNEDQGWVAHFLYCVLAGQPITVYGDGFQVRDVLHVQDVVDAMLKSRTHVAETRGQIYNLGGGMERAISVLEMLRRIERLTGRPLLLEHSEVRPGDQPLYISRTTRLEEHTGWRAARSLEQILADIHEFWRGNREAIESGQTLRSLEVA